MGKRLTDKQRAFLDRVKAGEYEDADVDPDSELDDEEDIEEVEYKGKRYRRVAEEDDGPKPIKKTAPKDATPPTPSRKRFLS